MDAVVASDLTDQSTTTTPRSRPPSSKTTIKVTPLEKVTLPPQALAGTGSSTPASLEGSRKRHRQRAPSPSPLDETEELTGTPRSTRIARLFPGGSGATAKPLGILTKKLLDAAKATLIPKTKRTKSVNVDVESAADILVLIDLIHEQTSIMEARRVVFDPNRQTAPAPTPFSLSSNAQFDFRSSVWSEKFDTLADQVAKLVSVVIPDQQQQSKHAQQGPATSSYALAASKHAPGASQPPKQAKSSPRAPPKQGARLKAEASLTLNQKDPKIIAGEGKTIPELMKILNSALKDNNVRVTPDDAAPIVVRNIHRHPSNDLVIYLES
ncbi:hypothetical protein DFH28DRAFT_888393, partial [Melampsora americana]